jgi:hypothetical protein
MAPNPISYAEIETYSRMRREPVRPFEVTILRALDAAYLEAVRAKQGRTGKEPVVSARTFSLELFDAMFGGLVRAHFAFLVTWGPTIPGKKAIREPSLNGSLYDFESSSIFR